MFNLFKKKRTMPEWAFMSSVEQVDRFLQTLKEYFDKDGKAVELEDGWLYFLDSHGKRIDRAYGLSNLSEECEGAPQETWPDLIQSHFERMAAGIAELEEFNASRKDFKKVSKQLVLHLSDKVLFPEDRFKTALCREELPGLLILVGAELAASIEPICKEDSEVWGKSEMEVFDLAKEQILERIKTEGGQQEREEKLESGTKIHDLLGPRRALETILKQEDVESRQGRCGAFVSFPNHFRALISPIQNALYASELNIFDFIRVTSECFSSQSEPLSQLVFWYKDGTFRPVFWSVNDQNDLDLQFPEEFYALIGGNIRLK